MTPTTDTNASTDTDTSTDTGTDQELADVEVLVDEIIDELSLSKQVQSKARSIAYPADKDPENDRDPESIAAGAVYAAALLRNKPTTQSDVEQASRVSVTTISASYQELIMNLDRYHEHDYFGWQPKIPDDELF